MGILDNVSMTDKRTSGKSVMDAITFGSTSEQPQDSVMTAMGLPKAEPNHIENVVEGVKESGKQTGIKYVDALSETAKTFFTEPFGPIKAAVGGIESAGHLLGGALSWLPSKLASEAVNLVDQTLLLDEKMGGESYGLTPEKIAQRRQKAEEAVASILPNIIGQPRTEIGKKGVDAIAQAFETAVVPAKEVEAYFTEQGMPNVGKSLSFFGELATFKGLHSAGKKVAGLKKSGKFTDEELLAETDKIVKEAVRENEGEIRDLIKERREANQKILYGSEGISAIDVPKVERVPEVPRKVGTTELVEEIPGERRVYQILDPLRNEHGFIKIPRRQKKLREKMSPELRDRVRQLGKDAERVGKPLRQHLIDQGVSKQKANQLANLYYKTKVERPMKAGLEEVKERTEDFKPFELKEGEQQLNVGSDANKKIKIGQSDVEALPWGTPGRRGLLSYFKTPEFMFDRYKGLKPLIHQAREIEATIKNELKIASEHVKDLQEQFPSVKLRKEAGASWHALSSLGADAMEKMGVEVTSDPKYFNLKSELQPLFKDLFDRINEAREKIGKRKIAETEDYLSFFAKESLFTDLKNLVKGKEVDFEKTNLVMDDLATIRQRQAQPIKDSVAFHHLKRRGLDKGVELELDPLKIYSRYLNNAMRHIHMSPLNAFVKELLSKKLLDTKTGKSVRFADVNGSAAGEIASWNNKLAGLSNIQLPVTFEKLANKGMKNLTVAQLFANARTMGVQTVALFPTAVKFGYAKTAKGIVETAMRRKNAPIEKSSVLQTAVMDAAVDDMGRAIAGSRFERGSTALVELSAKPMQFVDYLAREATFRTVWNSLEPLVRKGRLSEREAIRMADSEVIRTQGSGSPVELSPIQRNVIGKMATLWQTFTINHINFIAKDVLGINNPSLKPRETAMRVARYVGGMVLINALFEQVIGVQSPLPAPVQTLMRGLDEGDSNTALVLKTLLETAEAFPFGGSVKFGSSPIGPLVEHANDIAKALAGSSEYNPDMIEKAVNGDKKAMVALSEIIGKTLGVPGTAQAAKYVRGRERGESVPRAIVGRIGKPSKKSKKKRGSRRSRGRRTRR